jgi:glycolate oxidase FAD binding subunit
MTLQPETTSELQQAVREARGPMRPIGAATKTDVHVTGDAVTLSTARLAGIVDYSPEECVITALAGTPLIEIDAALAERQQYLPFDPPFAAEGATLGGTVAAGVNGASRYRYGGVRDFLIGARVVDGEGRLIRSGGKVVKNAAGFLLHHALVGSGGHFGVVTELTFKVFPRPGARQAVSATCRSAARAFDVARAIERQGGDYDAIDFDHTGVLTVTVAGRAESLAHRVTRLRDRLHGEADVAEIAPAAVDDRAEIQGTSCVKVPHAIAAWETLAPTVSAAQFHCAGAAAYVWTTNLPDLDQALRRAQLPGLVIRGRGASQRIGFWPFNPFEERVRRVMDPHNRFCAAPHSR